ncbi:hypothetical protein B9G49_04800 [Halorubrum sp. SD683]|nr:hypothetical protein B9G49_04800 [Halorubrum sp. SD683]
MYVQNVTIMVSRREFLKTCCATGIGATFAGRAAGTDVPVGRASIRATGDVFLSGTHMYQFDSANSGHAPNLRHARRDVDVQWQLSPEGTVESPPVGVGKTAYVCCSDSGPNVYAIDTTTGETVWKRAADGSRITGAPAVAGGNLIMGTASGNVFAFDLSSGEQRWQQNASGSIYRSLVVDGSTVYAGGGGTIDAFSATDGSKVTTYRATTPPAIADGSLFAGNGRSVVAYDLESGEQEWSVEIGAEIIQTPTATADQVFVGGDDVNVYALDASSGDVNWTHDADFHAGVHSLNHSFALAFDQLHVSTGRDTLGLDPETGEVVSSRSGRRSDVAGAPIATATTLIWAYESGEVSLSGIFEVDGTIPASPGVTNGQVIVPTRGTVYGLGNGNEPPSAAFKYAPSPAEANATLTFNGEPSTDGDGEIAEYRWRFGPDGTTVTRSTVEYAFEEPGEYPVTLEVIDDEGATDTRTERVEITEATPQTNATETTNTTEGSGSEGPGSEQSVGDGSSSSDQFSALPFAGILAVVSGFGYAAYRRSRDDEE